MPRVYTAIQFTRKVGEGMGCCAGKESDAAEAYRRQEGTARPSQPQHAPRQQPASSNPLAFLNKPAKAYGDEAIPQER